MAIKAGFLGLTYMNIVGKSGTPLVGNQRRRAACYQKIGMAFVAITPRNAEGLRLVESRRPIVTDATELAGSQINHFQ